MEQEHLGLVHDGARQGHSLTLPTGKSEESSLSSPDSLTMSSVVPARRRRSGFGILRILSAVLDVLDDPHVREPMVPKSVFYVTRVRWPPRYIDATELDGTAVRSIKPGDQPKSCRLAGARGTQQGEKLAPADLEVHAGHRHRRAVRLAHRD